LGSRKNPTALDPVRQPTWLLLASADARCHQRVATPLASRCRCLRATATCRSELPAPADPEANLARSPTSAGGFDDKSPTPADTVRLQQRTRPTAHMATNPGDVAITDPAEGRLELWRCAGIRYLPDARFPSCLEPLTPRLTATTLPGQAWAGCSCSPPPVYGLPAWASLSPPDRTLPRDALVLPPTQIPVSADPRDEPGRSPSSPQVQACAFHRDE
jgi:hypothetical protein